MNLIKSIPEYQGKTFKDMWIVGNLFTDAVSQKTYILPCNLKIMYNIASFTNYEVSPSSVGRYIGKNDRYNYPLYTGDKVMLVMSSKKKKQP